MKGFATIYLIAAVAGAMVLGALGIQTWRIGGLQEAVALERVGKELAMARIKTLSVEKAAAEASLAERDDVHEAIRRQGAMTRNRLREVENASPETVAALDCPVPDAVRGILRNRRGNRGQPAASAPTSNAPAPDAAPDRRPGNPS